MACNKGHRVDVLTFRGWGKENIIGCKKEEENGRTYVNFVWCKVCARHKNQILSAVKGSARKAKLAFIETLLRNIR